MSKKYKIVDDGGVCGGVRIIDAHGEDITCQVRSYKIEHVVGEPTKLTLEMYAEVEMDLDVIDVTTLGHTTRVYDRGSNITIQINGPKVKDLGTADIHKSVLAALHKAEMRNK